MKELNIVIATNNANKVREYRELFSDYPITVTSLKDEGIVSDPQEDGKTFEENALIKAKEARKYTNKIVISDDSGICVHALDNFPGIYSARWMDGESYDLKNRKLNEMLKDKEDKSAAYYCAIAFVGDDDEKVFLGSCEGLIVEPEEGPYGFGYDPSFFFVPYGKRFSQTLPEDKNAVSHRGKATRLLMDYIRTKLEEK